MLTNHLTLILNFLPSARTSPYVASSFQVL